MPYFTQEENILAAAYMRLSREDSKLGESNSITNQRMMLTDYISSHGMTLIDEFVDDGYTGTNFNRPGFKALMEACEQQKVNCILVKDLSRLGRNATEVGRYITEIFPRMGIRFIAVNDNYDSNDTEFAILDMTTPFKNLMNELYSKDLSRKIRASFDIARQNGEFLGGHPPYGYLRDPEDKHHLIVDPECAPVIQLIFDMKISGLNNSSIADNLNMLNNLGGRAYTEYVDDGYSGANTDRPSFQKLISDCRMGIVDTILVKDLSRFGRDYVAVNDYVEQIFPLLGVRFISVLDQFDSSKSQDGTLDMCSSVMNIVNNYYVHDLSQKIRATQTAQMRKGILTTKVTPLGYRCDDRDEGWRIEPKEAVLVRHIFDLALDGKTTGEIAGILNDEKVPTPMKLTGRGYSETLEKYIQWETSTIATVLRNETYTGILIQHKKKVLIPGKKIQRNTKPDEQFRHEGHHESIVSHEEWEKAQTAIRSNRGRAKRTSHEWVLKGKVRCGICNRHLCRHEGKRLTCKRKECHTAILETELNVSVMQPILRKRRRILEQLKAMENIDTSFEENRIADLRKTQADDYEGYINGDLDGEEFRQRKERIRAEIDGLENTIREKNESILHNEEKKKRMQWFLDHSKGELTRQMADEIIDKVIVSEDGVTVLFREGL